MTTQNDTFKNAYFILTKDAHRDDLEAVEDYEMDDADLMRLWTGDPFEGTIPASVKVYLTDDGSPTDSLGKAMSWLLFSPRFVRKIQPLTGTTVQFIPIRLHKKGKRVSRYVLANPLGAIDAICNKRKKKENVMLTEMILD